MSIGAGSLLPDLKLELPEKILTEALVRLKKCKIHHSWERIFGQEPGDLRSRSRLMGSPFLSSVSVSVNVGYTISPQNVGRVNTLPG